MTTVGVQSTDWSGDETPHSKIRGSSSIKNFQRSDPKIGRFDHLVKEILFSLLTLCKPLHCDVGILI